MTIVANFKAMPAFVKLMTLHGLGCIVLFLTWAPTYGKFLAGAPIPQESLWLVGRIGWAIAVAGLAMPTSALLSLLRIGIGRYVYLSCFGVALVVPFAASGNLLSAALGFLFVMIMTAYLFLNQTVAAYYSAKL